LRKRMGHAAGISLVETLIAMIILAVALMALAVVPLVTTRLISTNVLRQRAVLAALSELEKYEASPSLFPASFADLVHPAGMSFDMPASVDQMVTVTVKWRGSQGKWGQISLSRRIAQGY